MEVLSDSWLIGMKEGIKKLRKFSWKEERQEGIKGSNEDRK